MTLRSYFYDNYYIYLLKYIQKYIPKYILPNFITIINFILINTLFYNKLYTNINYLTLILIIYWLFDNLDGIHARKTNQTSKLGEILDHCFDSIIIIFIYNILCNLLNINNKYSKIILALLIFNFNIFHLYHKYFTELHLGYKYFTSDELLLCFILFLQLFRYISIEIINKIINYTNLPIIIINIINIIIYLNKFNLKNINTLFDLILNFFISLLSYNINDKYIISFVNMIFTLYLIKTKRTIG